jgi:tetratricopeptide (TPR) repeat protein
VDDAWKLVRGGQRPEAVKVLTAVLQRDPKNGDARLLLGSLLMEEGKKVESISQLEEGASLKPQSAEAQNALGEAYSRFGDTRRARYAFERAVQLDPRFGQAETNLGMVLAEDGKPDEAAQHLDKAIALLGQSPDAADAHYFRARIYKTRSEPNEVKRELQKAVALKPNFAEAWSDLGEARKEALDERGALAAFEQAVKLNPGDAVSQLRLGTELLSQHRAHDAVPHLEEANKLQPNDQSTLNALQSALRQMGRTAEANTTRQQLADLLKEKDVANQKALESVRLNNEGAALEKSGDLRGAADRYRRAVELNPDHVGMRVNYAVALLRLGEWTEGLNQLHDAWKRNPEDPTIRAALKDALSQAPAGVIPAWGDEWNAVKH